MSEHVSQKPLTGLHVVGELYSDEPSLLKEITSVKEPILHLVDQARLTTVGESQFSFPEGGYTFVILLAESHISIHTWPELDYITLDVFVCNVSKDNSGTARELFDSIVKLFNPIKVNKRELSR